MGKEGRNEHSFGKVFVTIEISNVSFLGATTNAFHKSRQPQQTITIGTSPPLARERKKGNDACYYYIVPYRSIPNHHHLLTKKNHHHRHYVH